MFARVVNTRENCASCSALVTFSWPVPKPSDWRLPMAYCPRCGTNNRANNVPAEWGGKPAVLRQSGEVEREAREEKLSPNEMVAWLCGELGIPGSPSFLEAVAWLKGKLRPDEHRRCSNCDDVLEHRFRPSPECLPAYYCGGCGIQHQPDEQGDG